MKGFTQFTLAALAASVSAVSVNLNKRESPLSIVLSKSGNTEVNVAVTNNGVKTLNLLSKGTFLDEVNPVEKVSVFSSGGSKFIFIPKTKCQLGLGGLMQKWMRERHSICTPQTTSTRLSTISGLKPYDPRHFR
jgi:deuterolysin